MGGQQTYLVCTNPDCVKNSHSFASTFCSSEKKSNQHSINKLLVLAMRAIGRGHSAAAKFSAIMGLPKPGTRSAFSACTKQWSELSLDSCEEELMEAGKEVRR